MFKWLRHTLALLPFFLVTACGGSNHTALVDVAPPSAKNIVQIAQANPQFSILVEAVVAARLDQVLSGPGPFTVFAPTNDAFASLLTELGVTKAQLLSNTPLLTAVLTYHVLPKKVARADIPLGLPITTVQGAVFKIDAASADLVINDGRNRKSKIIATDIVASNGIIHAVDKVLLPPNLNVVETALANPDFSILVEAVSAAGLVDTLKTTSPITVFAPTNAAFAALLSELNLTKAQLLANTPLLTKVLTYHVVPKLLLKAQLPVNTAITSVEGEAINIDSNFVITDRRGRLSKIVATDILTTNGVIHAIDKVILPAP